MYSWVLAVFVAVATALPVEDTPEVLEAKAKFTAAFAAAEKGEHAALAPVNNDVQAAAPVFTGEQIPTFYVAHTKEVADATAKHVATVQAAAPEFTGVQIPTSYIADTIEVAEAKAKHLATVQAPAPEFTGVQIPTAYLADTMDVADAKATFKAAFDDAAAGGLAAKQVPAPEVPAVAAVKLAAPAPVAAPVVYAAAHPYTYHTGLTYSALPPVHLTHPLVPYTTLTHNVVPHTALTYTHGFPYAGYVPFPVVPAAKAAEAPVVEAE